MRITIINEIFYFSSFLEEPTRIYVFQMFHLIRNFIDSIFRACKYIYDFAVQFEPRKHASLLKRNITELNSSPD